MSRWEAAGQGRAGAHMARREDRAARVSVMHSLQNWKYWSIAMFTRSFAAAPSSLASCCSE